MGTGKGQVGAMTAKEYREMLEAAGDEVEQAASESLFQEAVEERLGMLGVNPESAGEAEAAAAAAKNPKRKVSSIHGKPLNANQVAFAQGVIEGKSKRDAYRAAYPNAKGNDGTISAAAFKLMQHPKVRAMVESAWDETTEALTEDMAAQRRYVSRALVALSKSAKAEASRLRALELLGRSAGMFKELQPVEKPITAEELRKELAGHLKLVGK